MKKTIVVLRSPDANEVLQILENVNSNQFTLFSTPQYAGLFGEAAQVIDLSADKKRQINYSVLDMVLNFGDKLINGKPVSQHLAFAKYASIWYYHKFRVYFILRNRQYEVELVHEIINKSGSFDIYSTHDFSGIFNSKIHIHLPKRKAKKNFISIFNYSIYLALRLIQSAINKKKGNPKHIVIDKGLPQSLMLKDFSTKPSNSHLEYLLNDLSTDFCKLVEVEIPKFNNPKTFKILSYFFKNRQKNLTIINSETVLIKGLFSKAIRKGFSVKSTTLFHKYGELLEKTDDAFGLQILAEYQKLHNSSRLYIFKYLCFDRFFKDSEFLSITCIDENSPANKTIMDAAKANGVLTYGLQHGAIHKLHPAYRFTRIDQQKSAMTDKTILWGEYWKKLLINVGGYPEQSLEISGQIRSDIIPSLLNSNQHFFDKSKKNIVFASQPQRDANIRYRAAEDVFKVAASLGNEYWMHVKLHPNEMSDKAYYSSIAKKVNCENFSFIENQDLYQVISASTILITCFSTVGTETIYFKKPLIILDHLKQDVQGYFKEGVAFQATSYSDLEKYIKGICADRIKINEKAYNDFIQKYAYKIDGMVSDRIIRIISGKKSV